MFKRDHHQTIEQVLRLLNASLLKQHHCYFGGGTAIALRFAEYRESVDIDMIVSDVSGYRALRNLVREHDGIHALFIPEAKLVSQLREVRADQYGIRTTLGIGLKRIKFEIVLEGRIEIEQPSLRDEVCGIATLSLLDLTATKLLANSDRWADEGVFNRDIIDLAMMKPARELLAQAFGKAEKAYGDSVKSDFKKALIKLLEKPEWLEKCRVAMQMNETSPTELISNLRLLLKAGI